MPLSPSWKTHFLQGLAPLNAIGDRNVNKYSEAMTHDAAMDTKMKYLSEDHNFILIANKKKQVTILHNLKNYGGTMLQPTSKLAALFGIGPDAQVIALDASAAISTQSKCTQSTANIIATANTGTDSLHALLTPTRGNVNYKEISMSTPTPFLQNAILKAMTPCPFEIIQAAIVAHTVFVQENENEEGFNAGDIKAHCNRLITWYLTVGQESIPETRYYLLPGLVRKSARNSAEFRDIPIPDLLNSRGFIRNFIFLIVKCVPANLEHISSGSESSPIIDSSDFMNQKMFPPHQYFFGPPKRYLVVYLSR
jgi:hypothetical protein